MQSLLSSPFPRNTVSTTRKVARLIPSKGWHSASDMQNIPSAPDQVNPSAQPREKRRHVYPQLDTADANVNMNFESGQPEPAAFGLGNNGVNVECRDERDLTTEELLQILNQRLQPGPHWDREFPPDYSRVEL